jgi:hypothetical protein
MLSASRRSQFRSPCSIRESTKIHTLSPHYSHFPDHRVILLGGCAPRPDFSAALAMIYWPFAGVGNNLTTIILG